MPESPKCGICGGPTVLAAIGEDYEYACKPGPFSYYRCDTCRYIFINPVPPLGEIAALYPRTYYTVNPQSPLFLQGFIYDKKIRRDALRIKALMKGVEVRAICDIGCGDINRLASLARTVGEKPQTTGLDLMYQPSAYEMAKLNGLKLIEANVERDMDALPDSSQDLIIMSQLIEHLREPERALKNLAKKLTPKGRMLIETPNPGGPDYGLFKGKYWGGYHIPRHFHLFSQAALCGVAERAGLKVLEKGYLPSPGFWIISARNSLGLSSAKWSKSFWEFLNFSNLLVVGSLTVFDLLRLKLGMQTSNHYILAGKN